MLYLLLLATVSVAIAADAEKVQPELKPAESAMPIRVHDDERQYRFEDGLELIRSREERSRLRLDERSRLLLDDYRDGRDGRDNRQGPVRVDFKEDDNTGPLILRSPDPLPNHNHPDIEKQNKIIADVYSPDYYQPTWILDYRYQKTGGRDYTRGPGGQILILPKNVRTNEKKEFPDFDALLEHLRLSRLSEHAKNSGRGYGDNHDARRGYGDDHDARRGYGDDHDARRGYGDDHDAKRGYVDDHDARSGYQNINLGQYGRGQQVYQQQQQQNNPWRANRNH